MSSTYLLINLFAVSIPLGFSFHPRLKFWSQWRAWLPAILLPAAPFILWDVLFTELGVWGFNPDHLLGITLLGLPLEEWMFFVAIPYACLFTYHSLKVLLPPLLSARTAGKISLLVGLTLVFLGLFNLHRLYTGVTFLSTGIFLLLFLWRSKLRFWEYFYPTYLIIYA
ncbi:lycopene cyclase domain-containing protein, partial [Candidatus Parcubacteria bacterium]